MEDLQEYVSILESADVSTDPDDINELDNGPCKPGLLSSKPGDGGGLQLPIPPGKRRHTVDDEETIGKKLKQKSSPLTVE